MLAISFLVAGATGCEPLEEEPSPDGKIAQAILFDNSVQSSASIPEGGAVAWTGNISYSDTSHGAPLRLVWDFDTQLGNGVDYVVCDNAVPGDECSGGATPHCSMAAPPTWVCPIGDGLGAEFTYFNSRGTGAGPAFTYTARVTLDTATPAVPNFFDKAVTVNNIEPDSFSTGVTCDPGDIFCVGGPGVLYEGAVLRFASFATDASGVVPPAADPLNRWIWDWDDATPNLTCTTPTSPPCGATIFDFSTHVYAQQGSYDTTFDACDEEPLGTYNCDVTPAGRTILVLDADPIVGAVTPDLAEPQGEGTAVQFSASLDVTPADALSVACEWTFTNGDTGTSETLFDPGCLGFSGSGTTSVTYTFPDGDADGTDYDVSVRVEDEDSFVVVSYDDYRITNVTPSVSATIPAETEGGAGTVVTYDLTEPGVDIPTRPAETASLTIDWDDGSPVETICDNDPLSAPVTPCPEGGAAFVTAHVYLDDDQDVCSGGTCDVLLTVTDKDGASSTFTVVNHVVDNAPPANVDGGADRVVNEGTLQVFPVTFTDAGAGDFVFNPPNQQRHSCTWDFDDGNNALVAPCSSGDNASNTFVDDGVYDVSIQVSDDDGGSGNDQVQVTVNNVVPAVVFVTAPGWTAGEGSAFVFEADFADAGLGDAPWTIEWDFDYDGVTFTVDATDGSSDQSANVTRAHTYIDEGDGTFTVAVRVTDKDGGVSAIATVAGTVTNVDPVALSFVCPASVTEGVAFTCDFTFSDAGANDTPWTIELDWDGDGTFEDTTNAVATQGTHSVGHTYLDGLVPAVASNAQARVRDVDNGLSSVLADPIQVDNANPVATTTSPAAGNEGSSIALLASFSDLGAGDGPWLVEWDFFYDGFTFTVDESIPGVAAQGNINHAHVYPDDDTFTAAVRVTDKDSGVSNIATITVNVANVGPTVADYPDAPVNEGDVVPFTASFTDPGSGGSESYTCVFDWGDGSSDILPNCVSGVSAINHTWGDNGSYTVTVTVTDDDGANDDDTASYTVNNVAPVIAVMDPYPDIDEGQPLQINLGGGAFEYSFIDAGSHDTHTVTFTWGDATSDPGAVIPTGGQTTPPGAGTPGGQSAGLDGSHVYADDSTDARSCGGPVCTVTIEVCDDDGACSTADFDVLVRNVAPIVLVPAPDQVGGEGELFTVSTDFSDAGVGDDFTVEVRWGDGTVELESAADTNPNIDLVYAPAGPPGSTTPQVVNVVARHAYRDDAADVCFASYLPAVPAGASPRVLGAPTNLSLGNDSSATVALPFPFNLAGTVHNQVNIVSNGNVQFGSSSTASTNVPLPTGIAQSMIAAFWDDLDPAAGGAVRYQTLGVAPNREFVVEWNVVPHFPAIGDATIQLVLFEGSSDILMIYPDVTFGDGTLDGGASATIGVQVDPANATQYSFNTASVADGDSLLFQPAPATSCAVTVTLFDDDGGSAVDSLAVTVDNVDPVAEAGNARTVDEGTNVCLDTAGFTDAGVDDTHTATIDWADPTAPGAVPVDSLVDAPGETPPDGAGTIASCHVYGDSSTGAPGFFTATLTVNDDDSGVDPDTVQVTVNNVPPVASFLAPALTVAEGTSTPYTAFVTDAALDSVDAPFEIEWDFQCVDADLDQSCDPASFAADFTDSGIAAEGVGAAVSRSWTFMEDTTVPATPRWRVGIRARDKDMAPGTWGPITTILVTVTDVNPVATLVNSTGEIEEVDTVTYDSAIDDGAADESSDEITRCRWVTGDGFPGNGVPGFPGEIVIGFGLTGSFSDARGLKWSADCGSAGGVGAGSARLLYRYDDDPAAPGTQTSPGQTWTASLRLDDEDSTGATATATAPVLNVLPMNLVLNTSDPDTEGEFSAISINWDDPRLGTVSDDTYTVQVDWGDGTPVDQFTGIPAGTTIHNASHLYAAPNPLGYFVQVTVIDDDKPITDCDFNGPNALDCPTETALITVADAPLEIISVSTNAPVNENAPATVWVVAQGSSPDNLRYSFDWNNDGVYDIVASPSAFSTYTRTEDTEDLPTCAGPPACGVGQPAGVMRVRVLVEDINVLPADTAEGTVDVVWSNVAPVILSAVPADAPENAQVSIAVNVSDASHSDPNPADNVYDDEDIGFLYQFDWNGDGDFDDPDEQVDERSPDTDLDGLRNGDDVPDTGGTGTHVYTEAGQYVVTVRVYDEGGLFAETQVTIHVADTNDAPVAADDVATMDEDTVLSAMAPGVLGNDTDEEGDPLTATLLAGPSSGALTLNPDGSYTYAPNADFNGVDQFTYLAEDGNTPATVAGPFYNPANGSVYYVIDEPSMLFSDLENTAVALGGHLASIGGLAENDFIRLNVLPSAGPNPLIGFNDLASEGSFEWASGEPVVYSNFAVGEPNGGAAHDVVFMDAAGFWHDGADGTFGRGIVEVDARVATVTLTIRPVNDPPVFVAGANQTVNEDSGPATVVGWATGIAAGPGDEAGQALTFVTVNDNAPLFSVAPAIAPNGTLTFTPAPNANGVAHVTVWLRDNGGTDAGGDDESAPQTFTITVTSVNDLPVAANDAAQTLEDTSVIIDVLENDSDPDGGTLSVTAVGAAAQGTATIVGTTQVRYTPNANANGADSFTYTLSDGQGGTVNGTVSVTILAVNDPPTFVAGPNQVVNEDSGATTVASWASSISPGAANEAGQTLTFVTINDNGALFTVAPAIAANGTLTFTVAPDANGVANVTTYLRDNGGTANGGDDDSAPVVFTITVTSVNDLPIAVNDAATTLEDTAVVIDVLANDSDPDGGVLTVTAVGAATSGTPTFANGQVTYTPNANANGVDSFTYTLSDGQGGSATGTVTVTVLAVNDPPSFTAGPNQTVAEDSGATTVVGWATAISAGPANESGQTLAFVTVNDNGALFTVDPAIAANGTLTFTVAPNANGVANVTTYLRDNGGTANGGDDDSAPVIFTITVTSVNDPPVAVTDDANTLEDTVAFVQVLANDYDPDGGVLSVTSVGTIVPPTLGTVTVVNGTQVRYVPNANANGSDTFSYTLSDGQGGSVTGTVNMTVISVNDPPSFTAGPNQTVAEDSGAASVVGWATAISAGPANESGQILTFVTTNDNGELFSADPAVLTNGTLTFTPAPNKNGVANVTVYLRDNGGTASGGDDDSAPVTFTITITPVNDLPLANPDAVTTDEDQAVSILVVSNDTDADGQPLSVAAGSVSAVAPAGAGTASIEPGSGNTVIRFTPAGNFNGIATFTYNAFDGTAASAVPATVTVTVRPVNDTPVADDDAFVTDEDTPLVIPAASLLANDTDVDLFDLGSTEVLTVSDVTQAGNGTVVLAGTNITYTPNRDFFGTDSFTYTIVDQFGSGSTATVDITVLSQNDAPVAFDDDTVTAEDQAVTIYVLTNDTDPDGDPLVVAAVGPSAGPPVLQGPANGSAIVNPDNTITYTPDLNFNGTDSFEYRVEDGNGGFDVGRVVILVAVIPTNDPPIAVDDGPFATMENTPLAIPIGAIGMSGLLLNDSDVDITSCGTPPCDAVTLTDVTQGAHGSVAIVGPNVVYTPDNNFSGTDTFTYVIRDLAGALGTATVTVTVSAIPPSVAMADVSGDEGAVLTFTAVSDQAGYVYHFDWEDDGTFDTTVVAGSASFQVSANHAFPDNGTFTVRVRVTDNAGLTAEDTATATIANVAPSLAAIGAQSAVEGHLLMVQSSATDPGAADTHTWSITGVTPTPNATFQISSSGTVGWVPAWQDSSRFGSLSYDVTVRVTDDDGAFDETTFTVTSIWRDEDNDGMSDTWEIAEGMDPTRDDSLEDLDGDGILNVDEFNNAFGGPYTPVSFTQVSPLTGDEDSNEDLTLVVNETTDPDSTPPAANLTYTFEVYNGDFDTHTGTAIGSFSTPGTGAGTITLVVDDTSITDLGGNPNDLALTDNTYYWWRARATDGAHPGPWTAFQRVFYNPMNDAPTAPLLASPLDNASVPSLTPVLVADNASDADDFLPWGDLTLRFEVFSDAALTTVVASADITPQGAFGHTSWVVDPPLNDNTWYWWTVTALDPDGGVTASVDYSFFVNTDNDQPSRPTLVSPADGSEVNTLVVDLTVGNATDPEAQPLTYFFELDATPTFSTTQYQSGTVPEGQGGQTTFTTAALQENTWYWWRARASDGYVTGEFVMGSFFASATNDAPSAPIAVTPANGSLVDRDDVTLTVANATDPDGDPLVYRFRIFKDPALTELFEETATDVAETPSTTRFTPTKKFKSGKSYWWVAVAVDDNGLAGPASVPQKFETLSVGGGAGCSTTGRPASGASAALLVAFGLLGAAVLRRSRP